MVELLVVMLIAGVLGAAVLTAVVSAGRAERVALDLRGNTDAARLATERLRDEIRTAWGVCDYSDEANLTIWWRDEDGDGRIDPDELRGYEIADGQLLRSTSNATDQVLAAGLGDGSGFFYLTQAGEERLPPLGGSGLDCDSTEVIEERSDIAAVGVVLEGEGSGGRVQPTRVETSIALRNAAIADGSVNPNRPPLPSFTQSCSGTTCTFDASASHDEDGQIIGYTWSFGDGSFGSGVVVTHTFLTASSFPVMLTVVDDGGATETLTQFVSLADGQIVPSATFAISCTGLTCSFDPAGTFHSAGTIESYEWSFGDGSDVVSRSSPEVVSHTYTAPGAYTVSLVVPDTSGNFGSASRTANPTTDTTGVRLVLEDVSARQSTTWWNPKVSIRAEYPDGASAVGISVSGSFGPDESTLGSLTTQTTNAEGMVTLQASGRQRSSTYFFQVESITGSELAPDSPRTILLRRP